MITAWQDAPTKGQYRKRSSRRNLAVDSSASTSTSTSSYLLDNSPILKQIIRKTGDVCKASVKNRTGNVIIKAKTPHVSSVSRDRKFTALFTDKLINLMVPYFFWTLSSDQESITPLYHKFSSFRIISTCKRSRRNCTELYQSNRANWNFRCKCKGINKEF